MSNPVLRRSPALTEGARVLVGTSQLAAAAGVSRWTIRRYAERGLIPSARRVALGYWRFDLEAATDWLLAIEKEAQHVNT